MRPLPAKHRFHPIRLLLNNIRWGLMDAKFRGENLLREGRVPYTVVRPGEPPSSVLVFLPKALIDRSLAVLCSWVHAYDAAEVGTARFPTRVTSVSPAGGLTNDPPGQKHVVASECASRLHARA